MAGTSKSIDQAGNLLERLPLELLSDIAARLSQRDLADFSLVTKFLRLVAEPILFRKCYQPALGAIREFIAILLESPDLAGCVRSLKIHRWSLPDHDKVRLRPKTESKYRDLHRSLWSSMIDDVLPDPPLGAYTDEDGPVTTGLEADQDLVLLLSLLPALESFSMPAARGPRDFSLLFEHARKHWPATRPLLKNLKTLSFDNRPFAYEPYLATMRPFLELSTLSSFSGLTCTGEALTDEKDIEAICGLKSLSIQHISFVSATFGTEMIGHLVSGCKNLISFKMAYDEEGTKEYSTDGCTKIYLHDLWNGLDDQTQCLERLEVQYPLDDLMDLTEEYHGFFNASNFTKLRYMDVPAIVLLSPHVDLADALPPSVEALYLRACSFGEVDLSIDIFPKLWSLQSAIKSRYTALKYLELWDILGGYIDGFRLKEAFLEAGVDCRVLWSPLSPITRG